MPIVLRKICFLTANSLKNCLLKVITLLIILIGSVNSSLSQNFQWSALSSSPIGGSRFEDIFFINANTGWIVNFNGSTYKTTNAGLSWAMHPNVPLNRSVGFFDAQVGILGTLDGTRPLFRSTNGGVNWIQVTNLPAPIPRGICGISIVNENIAYACGTYFGFQKVIKTTNKGVSWSLVFSDSSLARTLIDCYFWSPDSGMVVGGYNTSNYENGNSVILITANGGTSWQRVYKSTRTNEWCWKISFVSRNVGFVSIERISSVSHILKTTNAGLNWTDIPFLEYEQEGIGFINETTGWVGGWGGPTYQTTNGGISWQLAGWGNNVNRIRFLNDTLGYAVGEKVYKYSRGLVGIQSYSSEVPSSFRLHQNYPNPFNPVTKIKFDLPRDVNRETQDVRVIVYDALGREISKLVNEKLRAGSYEVEFNAGNFSSGIFFYKLQAGNFSELKKGLFIK